jgi:CheY-like chemotaxis protein
MVAHVTALPRTILLVDDNEMFRGMLRSLLTLRGYTVAEASNAPDGLALAHEYEIDAALIDVNLPGIDGFEFCRALIEQQRQFGYELPVWMITGALQAKLEERAAAAGAILVLRKPFPADEVCGRLEREFARRGTPPPGEQSGPSRQ